MPGDAPDCTDSTSCGADETCDPIRGKCRKSAAYDCFSSADCASPETCNLSIESLPRETVLENEQTASPESHRVVAYFPAFSDAGDYFLRIFDANEDEADDEFRYSLMVTEQDDPDSNEPNNNPAVATPLNSGTTVTAQLSYHLDRDWYAIDTSGLSDPGQPPVIDIDLRFSEASEARPSWIIHQGDSTLASNSSELEGGGATAEQVRAATLVLSDTAPIFIEVFNLNTANGTQAKPAFNPEDSYQLTVNVFNDTDPNEGANRNDTPTTATVLNLGATGSAPVVRTGTLVATNDFDWFKLETTPPGGDDNSLLYARLEAAAPEVSQLSLTAQFFRPASDATCDASTQCPGGLACNENTGECMELWVQRPDPKSPQDPVTGAGSPETGGLSPNLLVTQLPIIRPGGDQLYLRVASNPSTILPIEGFDPSATYTLSLEHRAEPDDTDRTAPDNDFVPNPLGDEPSRDSEVYNPVYRNVSGGSLSVVTASGGSRIVEVTPRTRATASTCNDVPLTGFDSRGDALNATIEVTSPNDIVDNCTDLNVLLQPVDVVLAAGAGTVSVLAPPSGGLDIVTDGYAQNVPNTGSFFRFQDGDTGNPAPRAFPAPGSSGPIRIRLPSSVGSNTELSLTASGGGTNTRVGCAEDFSESCPGNATGQCPAGGAASCNVEVLAGRNYYDVQVFTDSPSGTPIELTVSGNGVNTTTHLISAYTAGSAVMSSFDISGYISYEGDQDFFEVPLPSIGPAGLDLYVQMAPSPLDLRVQARRDDRGNSRNLNPNIDLAPCSPGTLNERNLCDQPAVDFSLGPESTGECVYVTSSDPLRIWVNDVYSNDWDLTNAYSVRFELYEGCPTSCSAFVCGQ